MKNFLKNIHPFSFLAGLAIGLIGLVLFFSVLRIFAPAPGRGPRMHNFPNRPTQREEQGRRLQDPRRAEAATEISSSTSSASSAFPTESAPLPTR